MDECNLLLSGKIICDYLGIGKDKFYRLVDRAGLPAKKTTGDHWVASTNKLVAWAADPDGFMD